MGIKRTGIYCTKGQVFTSITWVFSLIKSIDMRAMINDDFIQLKIESGCGDLRRWELLRRTDIKS